MPLPTDHPGGTAVLMRRFHVVRHRDPTGLSGTGLVAWGVQFPDGRCVTRWNAHGGPAQTCCWDSIEDITAVHGHAGATELVWLDPDGQPRRPGNIAPFAETTDKPTQPPTGPSGVSPSPNGRR